MSDDTGFDLFDPPPAPPPARVPTQLKCSSCNGDWCAALDAYYGPYPPFRTYCTRCREAFLKRWPGLTDY